MKTKIIFLLVVLVPGYSYAQTGDAGSGWANVILSKLEWVKQEIRENEQIAKTVELVKLYNDTKQLTGVVASSVTDLKNATLKFQDDTQTIDYITQSQLQQLVDYVSWDDALSGKGYKPLLNLEQWYESETATFRDREGHLNATSLVLNNLSLENQVKAQKAYYASLVRIQGQKSIYLDREISRLFYLAKEYDNQARHLVIKLNLTVFNKGLANVENDLGQVFKKKKSAETDDNKKTKRSDAEIQAQIDKVYELQDKAAKARGEALSLLYELMRKDMNAHTIDLMAWRKLQGKKTGIPDMVIPEKFIRSDAQLQSDF